VGMDLGIGDIVEVYTSIGEGGITKAVVIDVIDINHGDYNILKVQYLNGKLSWRYRKEILKRIG
jgi:hypothetical protein